MATLEDFLAQSTCKGAHCAECGSVFTVDRGDGKKMLVFPNGAGGTALYVICRNCFLVFQAFGPNGIPNVIRDSKLTVALSTFNPANRAAFVHVH